jgi:hypothetical protein
MAARLKTCANWNRRESKPRVLSPLDQHPLRSEIAASRPGRTRLTVRVLSDGQHAEVSQSAVSRDRVLDRAY